MGVGTGSSCERPGTYSRRKKYKCGNKEVSQKEESVHMEGLVPSSVDET